MSTSETTPPPRRRPPPNAPRRERPSTAGGTARRPSSPRVVGPPAEPAERLSAEANTGVPEATDPDVANAVVVVDERVSGGRVLRSRVGAPAPRVDRNLYRAPSGRRASAGRVLAVGLVCFLVWTIFDANQLYHNALTSPFGARRTVAVTILRPLAAVANFFRFSGPVNAANSALGRNGTATSPTLPSLPGLQGVSRPPNDADALLGAPIPHSQGGAPITTVPLRNPGPPPIAVPTRRHPLVILDIGDSVGTDLGMGLGDVFSGDPYVRVIQRGKVDTGLARPDYYDWPAELAAELTRYHPGAVVMMLGANDNQSLWMPDGNGVPTTSPRWGPNYRQRVRLLMEEATDAGAHVVWVGLPPLDAPAANSAFARRVNSIAEEVARVTPGVTYVSSWQTLGGAHGNFVQYKRVNGTIQQIRYSDGVHLAPAGWDLLASSLLRPMSIAWKVNLHAKPLMRLG